MMENILLIDDTKDINIKKKIKEYCTCRVFVVDDCISALPVIRSKNIVILIINFTAQNANIIRQEFSQINRIKDQYLITKIALITENEKVDNSNLGLLSRAFSKKQNTYDVAHSLGNISIISKPLKNSQFEQEPLFSIFNKVNHEGNITERNSENKISKAFAILNIPATSTKDEVKKAYKLLAKAYHPDNNNGNLDDRFNEITTAYKVIMDSMS